MQNNIYYHIFNGDSSKEAFLHSPLNSTNHIKIAWREVLCEGPVNEPLLSDVFFDIRDNFLQGEYGIEKSQKDNGRNELKKILQIPKEADITLWFEYDLFCQINMIAALSSIAGKHENVYLICVGNEEGKKGLQTLGHYKPEAYPELFTHRKKLSAEELLFAKEFWQTYAFEPPTALQKLIIKTPDAFPYLNKAIEAHFARFPSTENGLSEIQNNILNLISNESLKKRQIVGKLLRTENSLGFGDLQYFQLIEDLAPVLEIEGELVYLNPDGKDVLNGKKDFLEVSNKSFHLGAVKNNDYRWDNLNKELILSSS